MTDPTVIKEWTLGYSNEAAEADENKKFLLVLGLLGEAGSCGNQGRRLRIQYLEEEGAAARKQGA
jgi:hypothetical protein